MKRRLALTLALCPLLIAAMEVPPTGRHLGSVTGGDFNEAHLVIDKRCTSCHSAKVIDEAIASGKDMLKIQHRMEQRGARLTVTEKSVLGVFWQGTPLKKKP